MRMVENRGIPALPAKPSYHAALMERLGMDRGALRRHPFGERLEALLAEVEQAYAGPADRPQVSAERRGEHEELREQYAPLFWHYLGRALRAADEVEFALMEARVRCLLREVLAGTRDLVDIGPKAQAWLWPTDSRRSIL